MTIPIPSQNTPTCQTQNSTHAPYRPTFRSETSTRSRQNTRVSVEAHHTHMSTKAREMMIYTNSPHSEPKPTVSKKSYVRAHVPYHLSNVYPHSHAPKPPISTMLNSQYVCVRARLCESYAGIIRRLHASILSIQKLMPSKCHLRE